MQHKQHKKHLCLICICVFLLNLKQKSCRPVLPPWSKQSHSGEMALNFWHYYTFFFIFFNPNSKIWPKYLIIPSFIVFTFLQTCLKKIHSSISLPTLFWHGHVVHLEICWFKVLTRSVWLPDAALHHLKTIYIKWFWHLIVLAWWGGWCGSLCVSYQF